jgi:chromosome segregation ATPase
VARINELAFELVAFERERQAFEAERERLRKVGRDFASDLEGHKKTLAEARGIQAQQARVIGTLTKDLEGHQRSIGDLQRDLTLARETLEREIAGHRSVIDALRGEIDVGVRAQNETVLRFQGEIAEHKAVTAALEADLEGHRGHAVTLTRELGEARRGLDEAHAELTRLVSELRARDELIALLRSELRHRWKNLKRALGPKRPTP